MQSARIGMDRGSVVIMTSSQAKQCSGTAGLERRAAALQFGLTLDIRKSRL